MSLMRNGTSDLLGTLYIEFLVGRRLDKCQVSTLGRRAMSVQAEFRLIPKELVEAALHHILCGSTASAKEDCELVGIIVDRAIVHGPLVRFHLREP